MVELVTAPWVAPIALPQIQIGTYDAFVEAHGLAGLMDDDDAPISRMRDHLIDDTQTDSDLLAEFSGRFCYRAWGKGRDTAEYIENVVRERHGNVLAHSNVSFIVTGVSRSLTHELVRHHVGTNPSQESQRYVTADGGEIEIIGYKATRAVVPPLLVAAAEMAMADGLEDFANMLLSGFRDDFEAALASYNHWQGWFKELGFGDSPTLIKKRANEAARAFLPNATETRLVWTANLRAFRHIIERRGDLHADLEIRRLAVEFTKHLKVIAPASFNDAEIYTADDGLPAVRVQHYGV